MTPPHGTEWGYVSGCWCGRCVLAGSPLGEGDPRDVVSGVVPASVADPADGGLSPSPSAGVADQGLTGKSGAPAKTPAQTQREYRERHGDVVRVRERERGRRRYANGWREDPVKKHARNALMGAVRRGRIIRQPCEVCGAEPAQAHHDDYTKPLDVRWLCRGHHEEHHRAERQAVPAPSPSDAAVSLKTSPVRGASRAPALDSQLVLPVPA